MPTTEFKEEKELDTAFQEIKMVFNGLGRHNFLANKYQDSIMGRLSLIELTRNSMQSATITESTKEHFAKEVYHETEELEHSLEEFDKVCPAAQKPDCDDACKHLRNFLKANQGFFTGSSTSSQGGATETKENNVGDPSLRS